MRLSVITLAAASLLTPGSARAECSWNFIGEAFPALHYSGGWQTWLEDGSGSYSGGRAEVSGEYLGGGSVSLPFRGSGVAWYSNGAGIPAGSLGLVDVSIDGVWVETVDLASFTWDGSSQAVYEVTGLGPGPHLLTLENVALGSEWGSWYGWLVLDHFEVLTECTRG